MNQKEMHYRRAITLLEEVVEVIDSLPGGVGHELAEAVAETCSEVVELAVAEIEPDDDSEIGAFLAAREQDDHDRLDGSINDEPS